MNITAIFIVGLLLLATIIIGFVYLFVEDDRYIREEEAMLAKMRECSGKKKRSIPVYCTTLHRWELKFLDDEEVPSEKRK